jgi:hypothetical protein
MSAIPEQMPYTFAEILACKTRTPAELQRDFKNLKKFDGLTNPRKFCGNPILYHYQMKNLLECKREGKDWKKLEDWFADPILKEKLWKDTIIRNRRDKSPCPNKTDVYECHRLNNGSIVFFKASTAKYIYKKFGAKNVLDPTAGWGGRMLAASSLDIKYTGFDTNVNMKDAYSNMESDGFSTDKQKMIWQDCLTADFSEINPDLVLTSPPYANLELYEHMDGWKNNDDFYITFMVPLMEKLFTETNCPICINVSPKMYKTMVEKYNIPVCDFQIDLRQQLGKQFKSKSQDYIYCWSKANPVPQIF